MSDFEGFAVIAEEILHQTKAVDRLTDAVYALVALQHLLPPDTRGPDIPSVARLARAFRERMQTPDGYRYRIVRQEGDLFFAQDDNLYTAEGANKLIEGLKQRRPTARFLLEAVKEGSSGTA